MKIVMLNGRNHKGNTYRIGRFVRISFPPTPLRGGSLKKTALRMRATPIWNCI